jgi:hypothetical protein
VRGKFFYVISFDMNIISLNTHSRPRWIIRILSTTSFFRRLFTWYRRISESCSTRITASLSYSWETIHNRDKEREENDVYINTCWCALPYIHSSIISVFVSILNKIQATKMFGGHHHHHHGKNNITIYLKLSINYTFF